MMYIYKRSCNVHCRRTILYFLPILLFLDFVYNECLENSNWMRSFTSRNNSQIAVKWSISYENITMLLVSETKRRSSSNGMNGVDFIIGGILNGKPFVQDFSSIKDENPHLQEVHLMDGNKNDTHIEICWTRKFNISDKGDFTIKDNTIRIIWLWNDSKPNNILSKNLNYPTANKSLQRFNRFNGDILETAQKNVKTFDMTTINIQIPNSQDTLYWCSIIRISKLKKKYHIIKTEAQFRKENEDLFHHIILYECSSTLLSKLYPFASKGFECYQPLALMISMQCLQVRALWTVGQKDNTLPMEVGIPFGREESNTFYKLEAHLNIQPKHYGLMMDFGMRIFYTSDLRKYDAGSMTLGISIKHTHIVPPHQSHFSTIGLCSSSCTTVIPSEGINIFKITFHAHLAGNKFRLRRFRNGEELPPFVADRYSFKHQKTYHLKKPLQILPNDTIVVECFYNTLNKKNATLGGLSTNDEMCLVFLTYYPLVNLSWCVSSLKEHYIHNLTGIDAWQNREAKNSSTPSLNSYLKTYEWTEDKVTALHNLYYQSDHKGMCDSNGNIKVEDVYFPFEVAGRVP